MIAREEALAIYRQIVRTIAWERQLLVFVDEAKTSGFYHAGRGQEGAQVGAVSALRADDYLLYAHRGLGYLIAKGVPLDALFADFLGRVGGSTRGLGAGIVHVAWPRLGVLGQSGTLGGSFPIAVGAGLSIRRRRSDQVVMCFFGDGAANRGTFHEALNAAAVWRLPIVWVCENNGWAVSVPVAAATSVPDIATRAASYGMPGVVVDGQDAIAVREAAAEAVERARAGGGPTLLEAKTHRFRGHFEGDPDRYRDPEEMARLRRDRDPERLLATFLTSTGAATEAELGAIRDEVRQEVDEAAQAALASDVPDGSRLEDREAIAF